MDIHDRLEIIRNMIIQEEVNKECACQLIDECREEAYELKNSPQDKMMMNSLNPDKLNKGLKTCPHNDNIRCLESHCTNCIVFLNQEPIEGL